jgi:hypothetical protein
MTAGSRTCSQLPSNAACAEQAGSQHGHVLHMRTCYPGSCIRLLLTHETSQAAAAPTCQPMRCLRWVSSCSALLLQDRERRWSVGPNYCFQSAWQTGSPHGPVAAVVCQKPVQQLCCSIGSPMGSSLHSTGGTSCCLCLPVDPLLLQLICETCKLALAVDAARALSTNCVGRQQHESRRQQGQLGARASEPSPTQNMCQNTGFHVCWSPLKSRNAWLSPSNCWASAVAASPMLSLAR